MKKSSNILNDMMIFNEIFRKNVTYDNIKITKNQGFSLSLEKRISEDVILC